MYRNRDEIKPVLQTLKDYDDAQRATKGSVGSTTLEEMTLHLTA